MDYLTKSTHQETMHKKAVYKSLLLFQGKKHEEIALRFFFFVKMPDNFCRFISFCGGRNATYTTKPKIFASLLTLPWKLSFIAVGNSILLTQMH